MITMTAPNSTRPVAMTLDMVNTLNTIMNSQKAGFMGVHGYVPTSGYEISPVVDIQALSRINTGNLYERRIEALKGISYDDVEAEFQNDIDKGRTQGIDKLIGMDRESREAVFNTRLAMEIASMEKTLNGNRDDNHRKGHDRCYETFAQGVKVHLVTESERYTDADGKRKTRKVPVKDSNGNVIADAIQLMHVELNRKVRVQGQRKTINSGAPVQMSNLIKRLLNQRSVGIRSLSLKAGNFEKVVISKATVLPENVQGIMG